MHFQILSYALLASVAGASALSCRCLSSDSCWPTTEEWQQLNQTTNGNLHAMSPVGAVCHCSSYNSSSCKSMRKYEYDSIWRGNQPAAVQYPNWEAWPGQNQSCYIGTSKTIPCGQGRVSLYSIQAQSTQDIQAGINFARTHNLRLAVRNTGHNYAGRSTAPESLQINTHLMLNRTIHKNFKPVGYNGTGQVESIAVTLGAGVQLHDMYSWLDENDLMVVGGSSHTVGITGGFIQGGGHSLLSVIGGMSSDNAIQFTIVVADGRHLIANAYQNSDLFWALRGGGGGTWGVVISVTVRAFKDPPLVGFNLTGTADYGSDAFWDAAEHLNAFIPTFNEAYGSMQYYLIPKYGNRSLIYAVGGFPNQSSKATVDELMVPFVEKLGNITGKPFNLVTVLYKKTSTHYLNYFKKPDSTGIPVILGSRILTRDLLKSSDGPKRLTNALRTLKTYPATSALGKEGIQGLVVAGPQTWANADIDSAVHPIWRQAQLHLILGRGWASTTSLATQQEIQRNLTDVEVPILKNLDTGLLGGSYLNEADPYEENFQSSFWGPNYPRLYQIKQKWDPTNLFIVRTGVGSENWDEEGLCPK